MSQYDEQDMFSEIQVTNGPKPISAPRASAIRYQPAIDTYDMQDPLTCTLPMTDKKGLNMHPPVSKPVQSECSSVTSTIGNF